MTDAQFEELMILLYDFYDSVDPFLNSISTDVGRWLGIIAVSLLVSIGFKILTWLVRW